MERTIENRPPDGAAPGVPNHTANGATVVEPVKRRGRFNRRLVLPILGVVLVIALFVGYRFYYYATHYVWTDNAQVTGSIIQIGALNAGQVTAVLTDVGQHVTTGQVVARVTVPQTLATTASGQAKLGFSSTANQVIDVTSPINGVVVAKVSDVGSTVAPGEAIVEIVDPTQLYVTANVNETDVGRIHPGEPVDVTVDSLNVTLPGHVQAVTEASTASFSLIPQSNASGNFTKVVQVVPVEIAVDYGSEPLIVGSSVEVNIHVQ